MPRDIARVALVALIILAFSEMGFVSGQSKTIVANSDPQINYSPEVCPGSAVTKCLGAWWDSDMGDGSVIKTTAGPSSGYNNAQTTMSYSFYGSSLEIYGLADTDGANMIVQIDNFLIIVNTSTGIGGALLEPRMVYNHTQLDPQIAHTLSIGWSANMNPNTEAGGYKPLSYAYFDHLVVRDFRAVLPSSVTPSDTSTSTTPEQTASAVAASSSSSQALSSIVKPGAIAGIVIAAMFLLLLLGALVYYILRRRRQFNAFRRRPPSPHVKVMIESQETRYAESIGSPTQRESWNARPHLSLPPVYGYGTDAGTDKTGYTDEKDVSYLDLESGNRKSVASSSSSSGNVSNGHKNRKSDIPLHPSIPSPSSSYPSQANLRINTRKSLIAPRHQPSAEASTAVDQDTPPATPFTPYCVGTATVARPQNAQLVPKPSLSSGEFSSAPLLFTVPLPPLPPLPPIPSQKEEKRRFTKRLSSFRRSRKSSRVGQNEAGSSALEVELNVIGSSRPSFDTMSVMTRSIPPPYTLHENEV
ncbi:hypothetical protein ACEPAI_3586 [Sanghuangporus weigelae]